VICGTFLEQKIPDHNAAPQNGMHSLFDFDAVNPKKTLFVFWDLKTRGYMTI